MAHRTSLLGSATGRGLVLLMAVAGGCDDTAGPDAPVASVRVEPESIVVYVDSTIQVLATARSADGDLLDRPTAYLLFDTTVARVTAGGAVTGLVVGLTNMVVASEGAHTRVPVTTVVQLRSLAPGEYGTCALSAYGEPYCWGQWIGIPQRVPGTPAFGQLASGVSHACGITDTGDVWCWGGAMRGDGSDSVGAEPRRAAGDYRFGSLAPGYAYTCGLSEAGEALCWGNPYFAGTGTAGYATTPRAAAPGLAFRSIAARVHHTCALTADGAVYCWGYNHYGQLGSDAGDGLCPRRCSHMPALVGGAPAFAAVEVGGAHTCALTPEGEAWCWGDNWERQLGDTVTAACPYPDASYPCSQIPLRVRTDLRFTALAVGLTHTCGLDPEGRVYCWGDNGDGQFGDGTTEGSVVPVPAAGGHRFVSLRAGSDFTCGTGVDGVAYCWGSDWFNALGNGHVTRNELVPARILCQP